MSESYHARIVLGGWGKDPVYDRARVMILLEALTQISALGYQRHELPSVMHAARYAFVPDETGDDDWGDLLTVLERGWGDCEDLAAARAGELRSLGVEARAMPVEVDGPNAAEPRWHIVVERAGGTIEDPSRALGME